MSLKTLPIDVIVQRVGRFTRFVFCTRDSTCHFDEDTSLHYKEGSHCFNGCVLLFSILNFP